MRDLKNVLADINSLSQDDRDIVINCCIEAYLNNHINKDLIAMACVFVKKVCENAGDPAQVDPVCRDIATFTNMYFKDPDQTDQIFE